MVFGRIGMVLLLAFSTLALLGCFHSSGDLGEPLKVTSATLEKTGNFNFYQVPTGGQVNIAQASISTGATFTYSIYTGMGTVSTDGIFSATAFPGQATVKAENSNSEIIYINIEVLAEFEIMAVSKEMLAGGLRQFLIEGLNSTDRAAEIVWSSEGGTISATGLFFAPLTAGTYFVYAQNGIGMRASSEIVVKAPLSLNNTSVSLSQGESFGFRGEGGVGSYHYEISAGGGFINVSNGTYVAPNTVGTAIVKLSDSEGNSVFARVSILDQLSVSPKVTTIHVGNFLQFTPTGGRSPYAFAVPDSSHGQVLPSGIYTAPSTSGTYSVFISDSSSPTQTLTSKVIAGLSDGLMMLTQRIYPSESVNLMSSIIGGSGCTSGNCLFAITAGVLAASSGPPFSYNYTAPLSTGIYTIALQDISYVPALKAQAEIIVSDLLSVSPVSLFLTKNSEFRFAATGGYPPYVFSLQSGLGTISTDGEYIPAATSGTAVIKVSDSKSHVAYSQVSINDVLTIVPAQLTLLPKQSFQFQATGGVGEKFFVLDAGKGTIVASGSYTASETGGNAIVTVSDEAGNKSSCLISIATELTVIPNAISVAKNSVMSFSISGGTPPYVLSMQESGGGSVTSQGLYFAPTIAGDYKMNIEDRSGGKVTALISVYDSLILQPFSAAISVADSINFSASGGQQPYVYSILESGGGSIANSGVYTAPNIPGRYHVTVTDQLGHASSTEVTVNPLLSLSVGTVILAVNDNFIVQSNNGTPPYTFAVVEADGGTINSSGYYSAPRLPGDFTIRVSDSTQRSITLPVKINPALTLSAPSVYVKAGENKPLAAIGGVAPYVFSIQQADRGSIVTVGSTAVFTAPGDLSLGATARVNLTDSLNHHANLDLSLYYSIQVQPASLTLGQNTSFSFSGIGGVLPYTWSTSVSAGTISSMGYYTSSVVEGTFQIIATDALGDQALSTVVVAVTAGSSSPNSAPTSLSLVHGTRQRTFVVSWIGAGGASMPCKLQYKKDNTTWTDMPGSYQCEANSESAFAEFPTTNNWTNNFNSGGVSVRLILTSDSSVLGAFPQKPTCNANSGGDSGTPNIDENCNGNWSD
jgi:hypothetical protein